MILARGSSLPEDGFSLAETLVATLLLVVSVVTLVELFAIAARSNTASRHVTYATVLAGQKLEDLRALDLETLGPSPPAALTTDTPGWVDYLDRNGRIVGGRRPRQAAYVRRWSVVAAADDTVWIANVLVRPVSPGGRDDGSVSEEVRLVDMRARRGL